MTYAYGTKGAPAVGGGAGGLPRREASLARLKDLPVGSIKPGVPPDYGVWEEMTGQVIDNPEVFKVFGGSGPNEILRREAYSILGGPTYRQLNWSSDSKFLLGYEGFTSSDSDMVWLFKRDLDTLTRLPFSEISGKSNNARPEWSPVDNVVAIAMSGSGTLPITWFSVGSEGNVTQLPDPVGSPFSVSRLSWSPDGQFLVVGGYPPKVYVRSGSTLTEVGDLPAAGTSSAIRDISWSPQGNLIAVGASTAPFLRLWKFSGGTFTRLSDPPAPDTSSIPAGSEMVWSFDGEYLAAGIGSSPFVVIYKREGDTLIKLANTTGTIPTNTVEKLAWAPNSNRILLTGNETSTTTLPVIRKLVRLGNASSFTGETVSGFVPSPSRWIRGLAWSPDGCLVAATFHVSSGTIEKFRMRGASDKFITPDLLGYYLRVK